MARRKIKRRQIFPFSPLPLFSSRLLPLDVGSLNPGRGWGHCKLPHAAGPDGPGRWTLNDICCVLGWKRASDEGNFTCIFTKNTRKFDKLTHLFYVARNNRRQLPPLASYWLQFHVLCCTANISIYIMYATISLRRNCTTRLSWDDHDWMHFAIIYLFIIYYWHSSLLASVSNSVFCARRVLTTLRNNTAANRIPSVVAISRYSADYRDQPVCLSVCLSVRQQNIWNS